MTRAAPRLLRALSIALLPTLAAIGCGDPDGAVTNERDASGMGGSPDGGSTKWDAAATDSASPDAGGTSGASSGGTGGTAGSSSGGTAGTSSGGTGGTTPTCPTIKVTSAIYAANCGAPTTVSSVATQCDGQQKCSYTMSYTVDPGFDPALNCAKDMTVNYDCVNGAGTTVASQSSYAPAEAGVGSVLTLECSCSP